MLGLTVVILVSGKFSCEHVPEQTAHVVVVDVVVLEVVVVVLVVVGTVVVALVVIGTVVVVAKYVRVKSTSKRKSCIARPTG